MHQDDPGLEQRLSRFEAQLDRFSLALHQWQARDTAKAASQSDVDERIRALEDTLDREAHALRQMHEEPLKQLEAQAASLKDLCATLSNTLQTLVTDLQVRGAAVTPQKSPAAWPLERVVHLHDELRRTGNGVAVPALPGRTSATRVFHTVAEEPEAESTRVGRLMAVLRRKYVAGGLIVAGGLLLTVAVLWWIERRLDDASARVAAAQEQVTETTKLANQEVAAARHDADRQITEARQLAQRAETVGSILTAPDLIRFNLASTALDGSSAQVLWSRTRGIVLSGSRLPAAPPESTYQLWLVTGTQSVGAGVFVPDATGRATLVVDAPPKVAGAVVGAAVTIEPQGGRVVPSGRTLLARFP